jgi:hypothetical protein
MWRGWFRKRQEGHVTFVLSLDRAILGMPVQDQELYHRSPYCVRFPDHSLIPAQLPVDHILVCTMAVTSLQASSNLLLRPAPRRASGQAFRASRMITAARKNDTSSMTSDTPIPVLKLAGPLFAASVLLVVSTLDCSCMCFVSKIATRALYAK